ncbi:MAG: lysine--tRNA ligase [Candidatus Methanomethylicaceae archaeon]
MHWIKRIVDEILARNDLKIVIHTGKTPSGPIHIGAEREQFICSAIQRELKKRGYDSIFNFIIDSYDPLKSIPKGLEVPKGFEEHIGKPLSQVPDPYGCHESYAIHFSDEFIQYQEKLGVSPNIIYAHELYKKEEMKEAIKIVLKKMDLIREIRSKYIENEEEWNPVMVICRNCGKIASKKEEVAPNKLEWWDLNKDLAKYKCIVCGYEEINKISEMQLKLSWRVDWAAKWAIFKVSCEPAGKDHCVKNGAYDMALEICSRIFNYIGPLKVPYEWLTLGGKAMKTHKGITFTPKEWLEIAPPEAMRYMILNTDPMRHIEFLPERIPDIVDGFDRVEKIYFGIEKIEENLQYYKDLYELCVINGIPEKPPIRLPYRYCAIMVQLEELLGREKIMKKSIEYLKKLGGTHPSNKDIEDAEKRLNMAKKWIENYAPENMKFKISIEKPLIKLNEKEKDFIKNLILLIEKDLSEKDLQNEIFNIARSHELDIEKAFSIIYLILLGSNKGPRLAPLLMALDKDWLLNRLRSVL